MKPLLNHMHLPVTLALIGALATLLPSDGQAATVTADYGVSTTGFVSASQLITTNISLTSGGTTWGYISPTATYLPNLSTNTPTAASQVATKAYVDSAVAAAGGGSGMLTYMGTTVSYTGNLGGAGGANAKCNAAFPGSRMMATRDIINTNYTQVSLTTVGWAYCDNIETERVSGPNGITVDRWKCQTAVMNNTNTSYSTGQYPTYTYSYSSYPYCTHYTRGTGYAYTYSPSSDVYTYPTASTYVYAEGITIGPNGVIAAGDCGQSRPIHCVK